MIVKCAYCGKVFETKDKRVHYCSLECRNKMNKKRNREAVRRLRATNEAYRKACQEINTRGYYRRKHERFVEIAKELSKIVGDIEAMTSYLEENCRLRH